MSVGEKQLMELLVALNTLETRCKRLRAITAVPAIVYKHIADLRNEIARWGTECIVEEKNQETRTDGTPQKRSER
jgi:hypothetical protein